MLGSGKLGYGMAVRARRVRVRIGTARLGGRGASRCGAVRCGGAVVVRFGLVGSGAFRRLSLGEVR